ncbi:MAG TPA: S8 family serine peptidase [Ferruginibacter sp.]|nr:S8 family serine peptidase [Ferruginibacter sp.]
MKKIVLLLFIGLIAGISESHAQFTRYIVRLKDKGTNPYSLANPSQYLTARSIQRRTRYGIAIDSTDLPITPRYIDSIRLAGAVTILNTSKWLNQVAIQTTDAAALAKINSFPFVIGTSGIAARTAQAGIGVNKKLEEAFVPITEQTSSIIAVDHYNYGQSYGQVHLHNGEFLHNRGFRGQGMQMAVLDAGFYHYLSLPTFDSIRNNNQVLGTWDFVAGNASVDEDHTHGMNCLSTIAANMPGVFVGTAPKASFYLYRTEDAATEYPIEEQNWVAGMERADSLGVEITSTSLGYYNFDNASLNYTYANMDGNTTLSARGADFAAKKGMLVVMAAGNEGNGAWHYIITPSDADSVMAVGAVSTAGVVGGFSSYGPSSDGQVKPSVAAVGVNAVIASPSTGQPVFGSGTSFACPNMAGLTTCLWQAFPEINNMGIINTMQLAATRATNPDNRVGYGIPDMKKAFVLLIRQLYTQQAPQVANCSVTWQWTVKTDSAISLVMERKLPADINYTPVSTQTSTGAFLSRNFSFTDDLRSFTASGIKYRLKMNIAADTSFYLDSITVNFTPRPNFGADKNAGICSGSSFDLTTQFVTTGLTSNWTIGGNSVANPAAVTTAGTYQLIGINNSGCADTALVVLAVSPKPALGPDVAITKCTDSIVNLTTVYTTTGGLTTAWTLGGNPVATPASVTAAGTYRLIATNTSSCSDTAFVVISNNPQLCITTLIEKIVISPNPVSDDLKVQVVRKAAVKVEISIVNAGGQLVFRTSNQQQAGSQTYTVPMKKMADGVYFVTVRVNDKKEAVKKIIRR